MDTSHPALCRQLRSPTDALVHPASVSSTYPHTRPLRAPLPLTSPSTPAAPRLTGGHLGSQVVKSGLVPYLVELLELPDGHEGQKYCPTDERLDLMAPALQSLHFLLRSPYYREYVLRLGWGPRVCTVVMLAMEVMPHRIDVVATVRYPPLSTLGDSVSSSRASPLHRKREDGLTHPNRHFENQSCFCLGSAFEVAASQTR